MTSRLGKMPILSAKKAKKKATKKQKQAANSGVHGLAHTCVPGEPNYECDACQADAYMKRNATKQQQNGSMKKC